jgi:hypothetical protein
LGFLVVTCIGFNGGFMCGFEVVFLMVLLVVLQMGYGWVLGGDFPLWVGFECQFFGILVV